MQTVRLRVNDKIYDKLMWLLSKFSRDEVEIIPESEDIVPNDEIIQSVKDARSKKGYKAKDVKDLFKQLEG